jgi:Raf kinase inhibitor-like YbhB/YbcL family protein
MYQKLPREKRIIIVVCSIGLLFSICGNCEQGGKMPFILQSPAFEQNQKIPVQYTCDGQNISPPLAWKNVPEKTKSLVMICDDPDAPAGVWVHWVCYDIPVAVTGFFEGIPKSDSLPEGGKQGISDFGNNGYGGPCPPAGTHRYFFKIYALDKVLGLPAGKSKKEIERAVQGHILAKSDLVGVYSRK